MTSLYNMWVIPCQFNQCLPPHRLGFSWFFYIIWLKWFHGEIPSFSAVACMLNFWWIFIKWKSSNFQGRFLLWFTFFKIEVLTIHWIYMSDWWNFPYYLFWYHRFQIWCQKECIYNRGDTRYIQKQHFVHSVLKLEQDITKSTRGW